MKYDVMNVIDDTGNRKRVPTFALQPTYTFANNQITWRKILAQQTRTKNLAA